MSYPVSLSLHSGETITVPAADARLLADAVWRLANASGSVSAIAPQFAQRIAYALADTRALVVAPEDLPVLSLALERLAMTLRLTPALVSLQNGLFPDAGN